MKTGHGNRKTIHLQGWLTGLLCMPVSLCALAAIETEPPADVDRSHWECGYCVFETGFHGEAEAGVGYNSQDSYKYGEYNGLQDDGAFLIGNATARYRDDDAHYLDLRIRDLGLDTRSMDIKGGQQGRYKLFLEYDEIPHFISDTARTPYRGQGNDRLRLPAGWVPAGSTAGMTALPGSLKDADLETKRKRLGLGAAFIPASKWETAIKVRHEEKDGQKSAAGTFFFNAAQLIEPVDYVTDEVEASVSYNTKNWQSRLSYYGSFFDDRNDSLTWQNAYNPIVAGANSGKLALPPDNRFNQILLSSGYSLNENTRFSGDIAIGRMEQDEDLLAATQNPNLAVALPRNSADAKVDTLTANLKVDSRVSRKVSLNAAWRYNDRDNKTPTDTFTPVTTDVFIATPRKNVPYSFTDNSLSLGGDYRINLLTRLSAGYEYQTKERTHQEVDKTKEGTFWGKMKMRAREWLDVEFKAAHAQRDNSGYHTVSQTVPPENPLMRKYNLADRDRDTGSFHATFTPLERVSIGLGIDLSRDDYENSELGLTESKEHNYNLDTSVLLTDATSIHAFVGRQVIKSEQAGSQAFAAADWTAKNDDTFDTLGIGVKHALIKDKLDIGVDYAHARSVGEIRVDTGATGGVFPDLKTDLDTVKLYADYRMRENLTLHGAYWYEKYNSEDWAVDGVNPATIPNVISLGEDSPDYDAHVVMLSVRYKF